MPTDDRTEAPTPRRLRRARAEGDVPQSPLLTAGVLLLALAALLPVGGPAALGALAGGLRAHLLGVGTLPPTAAIGPAAWLGAVVVAPVMLVVGGAAILGVGLQTGPLWAWPRRGRPAAGPRLGLARCTLRFLVAAGTVGVAAGIVADALPALLGRPDLSPVGLGAAAVTLGTALAFRLGLLWSLLGVVDAALARRRWLERHRMSRRELRQEARETEGDPRPRRRRSALLWAGARAEPRRRGGRPT